MKIILCIILCILALDFFNLYLNFKLFTYSSKGSIYPLTWHSLPLNLCHWTPILSEVIFIWLYLTDTFFSFQFRAKKVKSGTAYPNPPYSSVQRSRKMNMALKSLFVWMGGVCVCVCVSMLASQALSNFAEPCSYPSSTPKARTRTYTYAEHPTGAEAWVAGWGRRWRD